MEYSVVNLMKILRFVGRALWKISETYAILSQEYREIFDSDQN